MAVFDWTESASTALTEEPRISRTRYGDGYEERAPDGLNPIRQMWSLQFRAVDRQAADDIVAFFRARVGVQGLEAFDWTPLWATVPIRVVCRSWSRTQAEVYTESDINATFEQVFEP